MSLKEQKGAVSSISGIRVGNLDKETRLGGCVGHYINLGFGWWASWDRQDGVTLEPQVSTGRDPPGRKTKDKSLQNTVSLTIENK